MKTLDELRQFYESDLKRDLRLLSRSGRRLSDSRWPYSVCWPQSGVVGGLFAMGRGMPPVILIFILIGCAIIGGIYYHVAGMDYRSGFKTFILGKMIQFVEPGLKYLPKQGISKELFMAAGMFQHRIDRYKCEDMIRGKIDKTQLMFSEVHAEYKTTSKRKEPATSGTRYLKEFSFWPTLTRISTAGRWFCRIRRKNYSANSARRCNRGVRRMET